MKKAFGIILLFVTFLSSCTQSDDSLNDELTIYQEGDITIEVVAINDDRCPINVDCVLMGNAQVDMRINRGSETMEFTLNTLGDINDESNNSPTSATIFDIDIQLLDVQPYPEEGTVFNLEEYTVTISVN